MKEKSSLNNFIVDNHDLEILESQINVFNPFRTLKIERYEIRHSNVLAWLLDPNENHGLGDFFLKKVISQMVLQNEETFNLSENLLDIHLGDFGDTIVKREEKNIDILLMSRRNKFLLIIENKIHSRESKTQLTKYLNYAKRVYNHNYKIVPILLTKTGDEPEHNKKYGIFSHESIHQLINETLSLKKENLSTEVANFISFYLKTLEKTLGMNEELKDLCLKIYNEHRLAIDLIIETLNSNETSLKAAFNSFIANHKEVTSFEIRAKRLWFLPNELMNQLPKRDMGWKIPYPIVLWISTTNKDRIKIHIEVGPFPKGEERLRFIQYLESKGYRINNSAKRLESKYTRLFTKFHKIKDWTDSEELIEAVEMIYRQAQPEIKKITEVVEKYQFEMD